MSQDWFSAMLRFVVLIEGEGGGRLSRSVVLLRAATWDEAKERALALGTAMESEFKGGTGRDVRWKLDAVETLDRLGDEITDGREVYSEPADFPPGIAFEFDHQFAPEASQPGQSGV